MNKSELDFWGDSLARWPSDVVAKMGIGDEDAAYLTSVGLPTGIDWSLSIAPPAIGADPQIANEMPIVAFDGPVPICVDTGAGGCVVAVENSGPRLVNSSLRGFGTFLMLYQGYRLQAHQLDEGEAEEFIDEIEQRMGERDPEGMRNDGGYWPVVVEQMRDGFL